MNKNKNLVKLNKQNSKQDESGRKPVPRTPKDNTNTLAIKCYEEQCLNGSIEKTLKNIMYVDRKRYMCYAIIHEEKNGKKHLHIAIKVCGRRATDSVRVSRILKDFGIWFREEDTILMENRGLETLGSWTGYFIYLCHKDKRSENIGKNKYEISDFMTNLDRNIFKNTMIGRIPRRKNSAKEIFAVECGEAEQAGYNLYNKKYFMKNKRIEYAEFSTKKMKIISDLFDESRFKRINEYLPQIVICINISGNKTLRLNDMETAARMALSDINMTTSKTAEKDSQDAFVHYLEHRDIVQNVECVDGCTMEVLRNDIFVYTNEVHSMKNSDVLNAWTYDIAFVNEPEDDFIRYCENKTFYYSTINEEKKTLRFIEACTLGNVIEQQERKRLYLNFRDSFNNVLKNYSSKENATADTIDYSDLYDEEN